jgi:hypothetical protein
VSDKAYNGFTRKQRVPKPRAQVRFLSGALTARPFVKRARGSFGARGTGALEVSVYQPVGCVNSVSRELGNTSILNVTRIEFAHPSRQPA